MKLISKFSLIVLITLFYTNTSAALAGDNPTVISKAPLKLTQAAIRQLTKAPQNLKNRAATQAVKRNITGTPPMVQNKVRACQSMEAAVKTRSQNMNQFSYKIMESLGTMTNRTRDYYQRVVSAKTQTAAQIQNYKNLATEVQTKKMAAVAANTKAQNSLLEFNCNSENPGQSLKAYTENMQKVKTALQEYKGAVRNLTDAVRTAAKKGGQQ